MNQLIKCSFQGIHYTIQAKKSKEWDRGTLFLEGDIIPDYPRMPRILSLEQGIKRYYKGPFYIEEKVDGYNIRIFSDKGNILAVTRSGNVCPFTLDKILKMESVIHLLKENPDYILCGEMGGFGNPYNHSPYNRVQKETYFYGFDILLKNKHYQYIHVDEKYWLFDQYAINTVTRFGEFSQEDIQEIKEIAQFCDLKRLEGIIFKPVKQNEPHLKYVTFSSVVNDIRAIEPLLFEESPEFIPNRIRRGAHFISEIGMNYPINRLFHIENLAQSIKEVNHNGRLYENINTYFYSEEMANLFLDHLIKMNIHVHDVKKNISSRNIIFIKFKKELMKSSDIIEYELSGKKRID